MCLLHMEIELEKLLKKIRELREDMNKILEGKDTLLDHEVINMSKMMDDLLNEYDKIILRENEVQKVEKLKQDIKVDY